MLNMETAGKLLHDSFLEVVTEQIKQIKNESDELKRAKLSLELAEFNLKHCEGQLELIGNNSFFRASREGLLWMRDGYVSQVLAKRDLVMDLEEKLLDK